MHSCGYFRELSCAIKLQKNPYIFPPKWSAREPGCPLQQLRDLVRGAVITGCYKRLFF